MAQDTLTIQVGRETPEGYGLHPAKYSGVKIATWNYTYAEKQRVIKLAKQAFDELGYPEDADERADLDRKEAEVLSGASSSSDHVQTPPPAPMSAPPPSAPTPSQTPETATAPSLPKKEKSTKKGAALGLIGKQRAKFQAEKRAASLPNVKKPDGTASPRPDTGVPTHPRASPVSTVSSKESATTAKRKREDDLPPAIKRPASPKRASPPKRPTSPVPSQSSEESRGRSKTAKSSSKLGDTVTKKKSRASRDYSSSEGSDDELPKRSKAPLPKITRKVPPPKLHLNGNRDEPPDPEALRERYDELFPAYQLLSRKLVELHREAEGEEEGEVVEIDAKELEKMVARWEKWHKELEGIRRFFTT